MLKSGGPFFSVGKWGLLHAEDFASGSKSTRVVVVVYLRLVLNESLLTVRRDQNSGDSNAEAGEV